MSSAPRLVVLQIDPLEKLKPAIDTSLALAQEAASRGYRVAMYQPADLTLRDGVPFAPLAAATFANTETPAVTLAPPIWTDLRTASVLLFRQDPPMDMGYITTTYLLDALAKDVVIVNPPSAIRNFPEKFSALLSPFLRKAGLMPPTLITRNRTAIRDFRDSLGDIVLKPLYAFGGFGVIRSHDRCDSLDAVLDLFLARSPEPVMAQAYLPVEREGDKRIILIDGEIVGAVLRLPSEQDHRANISAGGRMAKAEITPRDREICEILAPTLKAEGLFFVGIDIIGTHITEINVTSPGMLVDVNALEGRTGKDRLQSIFWDRLEAKFFKG